MQIRSDDGKTGDEMTDDGGTARRRSVREAVATLAADPPAVVLVDVFGTVLRRRVPSGRVRELACGDLAAALGAPVDRRELLVRRRSLERDLTRLHSEPDRPRDHRLPEVADGLHDWLGAATAGPREQFRALVGDIEVATEAAVTVAEAELVAVLERLGADRPVVAVSDTNLTDELLGRLLAAHGLRDVFTRVVTSADAGETKRSGVLYRRVCERGGWSPSSVVMVGDNPVADGEMAAVAGIRPLLVAPGRWDARRGASPREVRRDLRRRLREVLRPTGTPDVFPEYALSLWLFTARLDAALRDAGAGRAVFLAREGRFLRELFDRFQTSRTHRGRPPIASSYLLVSRKSTLAPAMVDLPADLAALLAAQPQLTAADLADLLGVAEEGPDVTAVVDGAGALLGSDAFLDALRRRGAQQRSMLRELLDDAAGPCGTVHLVDVGWKGTTRDQLARAFDDRRFEVHLLGLQGAAPLRALAHKRGHLFANQPVRTPHYQVFSHFKGLAELLLAAAHGSVASYARDRSGAVVAVLDEHEAERRCHAELIAPFQVRTAARFAELTALLAAHRDVPPWLEAEVVAGHARLVHRPRAAEVDLVESLVQLENFGRAGLRSVGGGSARSGGRLSPRRHISGGGWPPLRMRHAGVGWQRHPYGVVKLLQLRAGRLR